MAQLSTTPKTPSLLLEAQRVRASCAERPQAAQPATVCYGKWRLTCFLGTYKRGKSYLRSLLLGFKVLEQLDEHASLWELRAYLQLAAHGFDKAPQRA